MATREGDPPTREQLLTYPLHLGDWLRLAGRWPSPVRAIYIELLIAQWLDGELPLAESELMRIARVGPDEWELAWPTLEPLFPVARGRRRNAHEADLRDRVIARRKSRGAAARKAARARWGDRIVPIRGEREVQS